MRIGNKTGLTIGELQALKGGIGFSGLSNGLKGGLGNFDGKNYPIQTPDSFIGSKLPWIYMNADDAYRESNGTLIPDVLNLGYKWSVYLNDTGYNNGTKHPTITISGNKVILGSNLSSNNSPAIKTDFKISNHSYLDFGGVSGSNAQPWLSPLGSLGSAGYGRLEFSKDEFGSTASSATVIMVMRSKLNAGKTLLNIGNTQAPTTGPPADPGCAALYQTDAQTLTNYAWGNTGGAIKTSIYKSVSILTELQDWIIVTLKYNFKDPLKIGGLGSEQAMYVNGKYQHVLVSNNWDTFSASPTTTFQANKVIYIGTDDVLNGTGGAGMDLAAFIMFPRWLNESEQFGLENYFRSYYNKSF